MLLLLLLPRRPRNGRERRASLLLLAALALHVVPAGASLPAPAKCPPYIDCAKQGRHFCKPGSSSCGRCLSVLEEDEDGRCVKRPRVHGKGRLYLDMDEEIDYLHSIIEKQQVTGADSAKQSTNPAPGMTSSAGINKSNTDAALNKPASQDRSSSAGLRAATTTPHPEVSAPPRLTPQAGTTGAGGKAGPIAIPNHKNDRFLVILISLCVAVGTLAVIVATVCYIKLQNESRLAQKVDYPAFRAPSAPPAPTAGTTMGDKTLAQSAQMYHYQHQKQQMLSMGNHKPEPKVLDSEVTSDEEEVGGDFTVYECPGLAPTGEMEVKNPLFDDSTLHYQGNQQ
ncbi:neural proliferation differentiation and control protein 1a [Betta splendens]|uniref:Neural proliferation differentiation and control protein 1a n=1 Tax=Betta splendens TaxID=158456 RepID=A0A6P7P5P3_BETSP|nr:neural proliferation differentiation and control protein 1a [Betta splendens]